MSALSLGLATPGARAADMPIRTPVYKNQPAYFAPSWTGFYVGLNAGYGWGSNDANMTPDAAFTPPFAAGAVPASVNVHSSGFIGGAQAGYNYQLGNSFVLGAEVDFQYSNIKGREQVDIPPVVPFAASTTIVEQKMDWFGTARARAGYLWSNSLMMYGTGGAAFGHVENSASIAFPALGQLYSGSTTKTLTGWTVGGGLEWAMSRNWTVKAEYLYYSLGKTDVAINVVTGPAASVNASVSNNGQIARVGLNYRF